MTPKEQLDEFIDRFTPKVAALAKMRKLAPGAIELVYDNDNALAIGCSKLIIKSISAKQRPRRPKASRGR